ncbi:MAG: PAS domain S-box protein, partial [Ferruginibacter sp.]|nr:PAS domain S-box protein [Ferruginibacter sp.]
FDIQDNTINHIIFCPKTINTQDKQRVFDKLEAVIKDKNTKNWTEEYRNVKADGSLAFVTNKGIVIRNENGMVIRMIGAMQDITRKKEEEQYLKLMSSVVTSTNDSVLITEAERFDEPGPRIIYVNEAFCKMTGYSATEIIGKTPRMLQGPKTDKTELRRIGEALRKWESCEATVINYKKNGEAFWINFTLSPVANEKGWFTHWISVERDVTERKNEDLQKELLRKIRIIFNEPISIKATLDKVLKDVTLFGDFSFAESWLLSADKKEIKRATYYVADPTMRSVLTDSTKISVQKKGEGLVGTAWQTLDLQTWEKNKGIENIVEEAVLINTGVKKVYALPFLNNAEVIGVLVFGIDKPETTGIKFENLFTSLKSYLGAEIKRKQLEQELNQIFNFAPDIITIVGMDGYFKKLNPAACELLGYSLEELMARPFLDFVHPEDVNITLEEVEHLSSGGTTFYFENRYITKTGKIKWLAWTCNPSLEEEIVFAVAKDITEKKELEVVLNKANHLARIGSWELDVEQKSLYWSDIIKEIHETPLDFVPTLEKAIIAYKDGGSRDNMTRILKKAIETGTAWDVEVEIVTQKGNERWIRSIGEAEFINGKCVKVYGSTQDINQRKRAEESIRSSEERRELIMNAALDAIICIDKNGIVTFWNPQAAFIFGWTEKEVMGKLLADLIIPVQYKIRHQNGMENYLKTTTRKALNALVQFSAVRKNGEEFPIELTILPIEQDGEEFFCAFVRDITARKLSETRLIELN